MILILLGTQDTPFERILKAVSKQIKKGNIREKVVAQIGCTKFQDDKIEVFDFVSKEALQDLIDKARIVITHGGVGIITECINKGKKVIVVPRLKKYKEHANDHQLQITKEFAEKGYVLPLYDVGKLTRVLSDIKSFKPKKYESNNEHFKDSLRAYINSF